MKERNSNESEREIDQLFNVSRIPVAIIDDNKNIKLNYGIDMDKMPYINDEEFLKHIITDCRSSLLPAILTEYDTITYGYFEWDTSQYIIWGPICLEKLNKRQISNYKNKHLLSCDESSLIIETSMEVLITIMRIVYEKRFGIPVNENEIFKSEKFTEENTDLIRYSWELYELENSENEYINNSYWIVQKFIEMGKNGDIEGFKKNFKLSLIEKGGKVANDNNKKYEYLAVITISYLVIYSIEAGLQPLLAHSKADIYLQKIEKAHNISEYFNILYCAGVEYCTLIHELKMSNEKNSSIEKCKNYISSNLTKGLNLEEISNHVGLSKYYLGKLFKETCKITIQEYIMKEKTERAANMLKHSEESLANISNYLHFHSQSYFGEVFKRYQGLTPKKYRDKYSKVGNEYANY